MTNRVDDPKTGVGLADGANRRDESPVDDAAVEEALEWVDYGDMNCGPHTRDAVKILAAAYRLKYAEAERLMIERDEARAERDQYFDERNAFAEKFSAATVRIHELDAEVERLTARVAELERGRDKCQAYYREGVEVGKLVYRDQRNEARAERNEYFAERNAFAEKFSAATIRIHELDSENQCLREQLNEAEARAEGEGR